MFKRLLLALSLLGVSGSAFASGNVFVVPISSGNAYANVETYINNTGNSRQAVVIGDKTSSDTVHVDQIQGMQVYLGTSTATNIGTIGNTGFNITGTLPAFTATPTFQPVGTTTVTFNGSAQPVTQSGSFIVTQSTVGAILQTGSNAIGSITNTGFNVNNTPAVTQSGAFIVTQSTVGAIPLIGGSAVSTSNPVPVQSTGTTTITGTVTANISGSISNTSFLATPTGTYAVSLSSVAGSAISLGNNTMANSLPVTMASNQTQWAVMGSTSLANSAGTQIVFISTFANVAASQTNQILAAGIASTKLCVHSLSMVTGGTATNVTFNTSGGTAITALYANAANGGLVLPWSTVPYFCSVSADGLGVTTAAGSTTGITLLYGKE